MRARAAGFAEGAGGQASSRRERIGGSVMGRILGPFGIDIGIAWTSVSVPKASHGSGRTACRHRAIPDFPELEPPLRTIT